MRETLIYGLAFLLILGAGALLILPRLTGDRDGDGVSQEPRGAPADPDAPPGVTPAPVEPDLVEPGPAPEPAQAIVDPALTALPGRLRITVTGAGGALRGPLKPLVGARLAEPAGGSETPAAMTIEPTAAEVAFGAVGHQWVVRSIGTLEDGMTIELPPAAPTIVVRVTETDGTPAVNVPLRVRPASPLGRRRTDDGGTLVLDDLPPGNVFVDATSRERTGPALRLRTGVDRDVAMQLDPAWAVRGVVRSPGGKPVPGAVVEAFAAIGPIGHTVATDAQGRFDWRGPIAGVASFRIRSPGFAELAAEAIPPATGALATDLGTLTFEGPGPALAVTVRSAIPGGEATVTVEPAAAAIVRELFGPSQALDRPRSKTASDGETVLFEGLPSDMPFRVSLRGAGVPVDAVVAPEPGEELALTLMPEAGHVLGGVITAPDGTPQAGVRVLVSTDPRDGDLKLADDREAFTGVGGGFEVYGIGARVAYLRAYVPGYRGLLRRVELPLEAPLALRLEPAPTDATRRIEGRVRDDQGRPLEGVTIQAAGLRTQSDAQGRFRLDGVVTQAPVLRVAYGYEPGPVAASAPHPKAFGGRAFTDVTLGGGKVLDLVLARAVDVTCTLRDAIDDAPIHFAHVLVRGPQGGIVFDRVLATRDGVLRMPALSVFDHARTHPSGIEPRAPVRKGGISLFICTHERRYDGDVLVEAGRALDAGPLLMKHGMRIRGVVKTRGGKPLPNARVSGMDAGWQSRGTDPEREREMLYRAVRTDAEGRFELRGFNPRRGANLVAWTEGRAPVAQNVLLPPFSDKVDAEVEIVLGEGSHLLLILEDAGTKRPVEGAMMDIEFAVDGEDYLDLIHFGAFAGPVGSTREWKAAADLLLFPTDERGHYRLGPVRPGPYELWLEHPAYLSQRTKLTLPARGETFYDAVTYRHRGRAGRRFDRGTISFKGNTLRLIITLEGR